MLGSPLLRFWRDLCSIAVSVCKSLTSFRTQKRHSSLTGPMPPSPVGLFRSPGPGFVRAFHRLGGQFNPFHCDNICTLAMILHTHSGYPAMSTIQGSPALNLPKICITMPTEIPNRDPRLPKMSTICGHPLPPDWRGRLVLCMLDYHTETMFDVLNAGAQVKPTAGDPTGSGMLVSFPIQSGYLITPQVS